MPDTRKDVTNTNRARVELRVSHVTKKILKALAFFKQTSLNKVVGEILDTTLSCYVESAIENNEINDREWRRILKSALDERKEEKAIKIEQLE